MQNSKDDSSYYFIPVENNKEKWTAIFIFMIAAFIFYFNLAFHIPYIEKTSFSKIEAERLLQDTYNPLENFNDILIDIDNDKYQLVPESIKGEEDFKKLFHHKINDSEINDFYETLIVEKNRKLYVNRLAYIPNIYCDNGRVTKSYIKKSKHLFSKKIQEKLIIKESWMISGERNARTNYFKKNKDGQWTLDSINGISAYEFNKVTDNPWHDTD